MSAIDRIVKKRQWNGEPSNRSETKICDVEHLGAGPGPVFGQPIQLTAIQSQDCINTVFQGERYYERAGYQIICKKLTFRGYFYKAAVGGAPVNHSAITAIIWLSTNGNRQGGFPSPQMVPCETATNVGLQIDTAMADANWKHTNNMKILWRKNWFFANDQNFSGAQYALQNNINANQDTFFDYEIPLDDIVTTFGEVDVHGQQIITNALWISFQSMDEPLGPPHHFQYELKCIIRLEYEDLH